MPERNPACSYCLALLLALACLGGCGQKGPLYLPEDNGQEQQ